MRHAFRSLVAIFPLGLAACAVPPPSGPSVMALPADGKNFAVFQQEDMACRNYAYQMSGGQQQANAGTDRAVGSAVVGTALGAAAGAALGSLSGQMGAGAAIGGTAGLLVGGAAGAGNAQASYAGQQQQYDVTYTQCMYAKGNTVQSAPATGYAAGYPGYGTYSGYPGYAPTYPGYPTGYPGYAPGYYAPPAVVYSPSVIVGGGWGGGWGGGYRGYGYGRRGWYR